MKAVVCTKLGEPNLLEIKEVDKPKINKDEVVKSGKYPDHPVPGCFSKIFWGVLHLKIL